LFRFSWQKNFYDGSGDPFAVLGNILRLLAIIIAAEMATTWAIMFMKAPVASSACYHTFRDYRPALGRPLLEKARGPK